MRALVYTHLIRRSRESQGNRFVLRRLSANSEALRGNDSIFWCPQVVFPDTIAPGSVLVNSAGIIADCHVDHTLKDAEQLAETTNVALINLGENSSSSCLSPGLIDVHVHISALGRDWEGYTSATKAAAAGGITTIIGMPLNSLPPTTSPEILAQEKSVANEKSSLYVDVGLWGGVVPSNCTEQKLDDLLQAGVLGLKAFLSPLPPAAGYEAVSPEQLLKAASICGRHNKPILVHAELMTEQDLLNTTQAAYENQNSQQSYQAHVNSRPPKWEQDAIKVVCEAASFCHMHIVHLSDANGCSEMIQTTRKDPNKRLTVETCSHYLLLDSSMIQDGDTRVKCFPPIRDAPNRERLWEGLEEGWIDMVTSDHSPCEPSMRCRETGDLKKAWGGLSGLQYQLQATWTGAVARQHTPLEMANWWSRNSSELAGMTQSKGSIEPGKQADFCWWDPSHKGAPNEYIQEYHRWPGDTYFADNEAMRGRVLGTWVKGAKVYDGLEDKHLMAAGSFLLCI